MKSRYRAERSNAGRVTPSLFSAAGRAVHLRHVRRSRCTRAFQPGFRLSALDVVVLIVGAAASAYAGWVHGWTGALIAFVVLHFFLFCNVLRMSRPLELAWAGVFAALSVAAALRGTPSRPVVVGVSTLVTVVVALVEIRRPSYHGVGWKTLNPGLPEWWKSMAGSGSR